MLPLNLNLINKEIHSRISTNNFISKGKIEAHITFHKGLKGWNIILNFLAVKNTWRLPFKLLRNRNLDFAYNKVLDFDGWMMTNPDVE